MFDRFLAPALAESPISHLGVIMFHFLSHLISKKSTKPLHWVVLSLVQDGATGVICVWHCTMQQRRQQGIFICTDNWGPYHIQCWPEPLLSISTCF